jgi:glycosyltransferase involved in cell wall biosynthesis
MKILVNAVAARLGGAATYLRHFLRLAARSEHTFVVLTSRGLDIPEDGVERLEFGSELRNPARRFLFDQVKVPELCRELHCDALLSTNNYASLVSPVRQVLLVRNPIFFSRLFLERLAREGPIRLRAESFIRRNLILQSIMAADVSVFPTQAMLDEVVSWASLPRERCRVVPHGFDADDFRRRAATHREEFARRMSPETFNVSFVSHYAPHKSLDILFTAVRLARERQKEGTPRLHLWLTADIDFRRSRGKVWPKDLAAFEALASEGAVTDLGEIPHERIAGLYSASNALVFPSLAESFGHPLKEAMSVGIPIVASDIPVNREICGDVASYFRPSDAESLAASLLVAISRGAQRAAVDEARLSFGWEDHVAAVGRLLAGED